jgi:hypothetical protein
MTQFILIIVFNSMTTGGVVSTQDFDTRGNCENAMQHIISLDLYNFKTAFCVPK